MVISNIQSKMCGCRSHFLLLIQTFLNINNVQIEVFPASIIASMFNFNEKPLLEFSSSEKADVDMKQLFG